MYIKTRVGGETRRCLEEELKGARNRGKEKEMNSQEEERQGSAECGKWLEAETGKRLNTTKYTFT